VYTLGDDVLVLGDPVLFFALDTSSRLEDTEFENLLYYL